MKSYTDKTIGDLLTTAGVPWSWYMEGYKVMADAVAASSCPATPSDCAAMLTTYPCVFDPSDDPFEYYDSTRDKPAYLRDYAKLADDLAGGTLPAVTFVKAVGYHTEYPGYSLKLSDGVKFATGVLAKVQASKYANDALVVVTYDEGGGYFDHVKPPADNAADGKSYGTRVPFLAVGPFVKKNFVSHVVMEHSSLVKFIEWNWLGMQTGQLSGRDANVNNIGSVLDPATTGVNVPE
jgi:phospholipase C